MALIDHWKSEDARSEFIKDSVDEWMIDLEKFINKNYKSFIKDPKKVLKTFALKYVNKHLELFEDAVESGEKLIEGIK